MEGGSLRAGCWGHEKTARRLAASVGCGAGRAAETAIVRLFIGFDVVHVEQLVPPVFKECTVELLHQGIIL